VDGAQATVAKVEGSPSSNPDFRDVVHRSTAYGAIGNQEEPKSAAAAAV
jgi:hypothetical protein